ncbi:MAG TPA: Fe-S protein assembly co-chaperone HscB [Burkholderiaceae bacterium]
MNQTLLRNHFELFGLPERFALDPGALDAAYRKVQGVVHPDRFASATDNERRVAMQLAANANEALRTLRDPARRAGYICQLHDVPVEMHSNTSMPQSFLVAQMQWREQLEEACEQRDPAALDALRARVGAERNALLERVAAALDDERDFETAAALVRQLAFYDRLGGEIDAAEDRILGH